MKNPILLLALFLAPAICTAQPDTLVVPSPPAPMIPPVAPDPPAPPVLIEDVEKHVIVERDGGVERILVAGGDTTVVITKEADGRETVVVKVKGGEADVDSAVARARRAYLAAGMDSQGGYVRVEADGPDTTKGNDPVIIEMKRRTYRIYTEKHTMTDDSVRIAERIRELRTERRNLFTYWSGIDLGLNMLLGPDGSTEMGRDAEFMELDQARSRFLAINFMEQKIEFGRSNIGILTGLGWEFTSYHLRNNVLLQYHPDSIYAITEGIPEFSKNKLRQIGFRMPLMLEFNSKRAPLPTEEELRARKNFTYDRKGNFHMAMGVVGSWYYETMYKQIYRRDGNRQNDRSKGDLHLQPFRAALSARLGYGGFNLFAEYALTTLFRDGKGPELTPFNVGLTLIGFN